MGGNPDTGRGTAHQDGERGHFLFPSRYLSHLLCLSLVLPLCLPSPPLVPPDKEEEKEDDEG